MRILLLASLIGISVFATAQDKSLLQKQLMEIMLDFPNQFSNLKQPKDSFFLKFRISGTTDAAMILGSGSSAYISAFLNVPRSDTEARNLFEKWVALISSIDFNGAVLTSSDCKMDKFGLYCKVRNLDNSKGNIDPTYLPFIIKVLIVKVKDAYAAGLQIGRL